MKSKSTLLFLGCTLVVFAMVFMARYQRNHGPQSASRSVAAADSRSTGAASSSAANGITRPSAKGAIVQPKVEVTPQFTQWVEAEAQLVDDPHVDTLKKEEELRARAAQLQPEESQWLVQNSIDPQASAGSKVVSIYLISESGARSSADLKSIALAPLSEAGDTATHSLGETKQSQEKAMRIMAIDSLAKRAREDLAAREELRDLRAQLTDPTLRSHVDRRLQEVSTN